MSSILTNGSALVALQTLKGINANLAKTQNEISTGKSVNNAQDNAAIWSIAKTLETDESSATNIQKSLNVAAETVSTARKGVEFIRETLSKMDDLITNANNSDSGFAEIQKSLAEYKEQITATIAGTQSNGVNLLSTDGINGAAEYKVLASVDRTRDASGVSTLTPSYITIDSLDFTANLDLTTIPDVEDQASAETALTAVKALLVVATDGASTLGAKGQRISEQSDFLSELSDSLKLGVSALVDADMEEASARLQALQTQQQLGVQSLSIANQAPSTILSLFRG